MPARPPSPDEGSDGGAGNGSGAGGGVGGVAGRVAGASPLRHSPVEAAHARLGARLVDYAGWLLPLRYGSELAEHHAVRRAAGVFDLSHMAEIEVAGPEAPAALDAALVGLLSELAEGRARYTMCCDESGGVLDDLVVYRTGPEAFLVVANAANAAVVLAELAARAAPFGAAVTDATDRHGLVAIQGPLALEVLQSHTATALGSIAPYGWAPARLAGAEALVARTGYTGEDGFECFLPPSAATVLFEALVEAGAARGVLPAGLAARDSLRLEAGMPLYGNELTRAVTPYEAGLGRVVRLDKPGDFVGRAALAARAAAGPVTRLVGLRAEGRRAPRHGYPVLEAAGGPPVGAVTSGALSPTLGWPIAMAYVPARDAEVGTHLVVDVRGEPVDVEVTGLPFYRRHRRS